MPTVKFVIYRYKLHVKSLGMCKQYTCMNHQIIVNISKRIFQVLHVYHKKFPISYTVESPLFRGGRINVHGFLGLIYIPTNVHEKSNLYSTCTVMRNKPLFGKCVVISTSNDSYQCRNLTH